MKGDVEICKAIMGQFESCMRTEEKNSKCLLKA
ncbi:hypothetical protein C5S29_08910 [ANME-1 cluster archaeon GoMg3.2]|nr:hypothetical protein [ANME-1 cluster archaeon GoMg3.2]